MRNKLSKLCNNKHHTFLATCGKRGFSRHTNDRTVCLIDIQHCSAELDSVAKHVWVRQREMLSDFSLFNQIRSGDILSFQGKVVPYSVYKENTIKIGRVDNYGFVDIKHLKVILTLEQAHKLEVGSKRYKLIQRYLYGLDVDELTEKVLTID